MYAQLGNIQFEGLNGFDSWEHKDTTTYAQHDLIGAKPVLAATGNDLEEISLQLKLRAEFINPENAVQALKKSKDAFEVLPLIKGSGRYMGDFVITDLSVSDRVALPDGTVLESSVSITLREYATTDKLQQQQSAARKNAFATGTRRPLALAAPQVSTTAQLAGRDLTAVAQHTNIVDDQCSQYETNVSQRQNISDRIQKSLKRMDESLAALGDKLATIEPLHNTADILSAAGAVRDQVGLFTFPITSISDLKLNNLNLQGLVRNLGRTSASLTNIIATRRG